MSHSSFFGIQPPKTLHDFEVLPDDAKHVILRMMKPSELILMWSTAKTTALLINNDRILLKSLGANTFEEWMTRITAARKKILDDPKNIGLSPSYYGDPRPFFYDVLDGILKLSTLEIIMCSESERMTHLFSAQQLEQLAQLNVSEHVSFIVLNNLYTLVILNEKLISFDELISYMQSVNSRQHGEATHKSFDLLNRLICSPEGLTALHDKLLTFNEVTTFDQINPNFFTILLEEPDCLTLRKRRQYLLDDATDNKEFTTRFKALPFDLQTIVVNGISLETAEKLIQHPDRLLEDLLSKEEQALLKQHPDVVWQGLQRWVTDSITFAALLASKKVTIQSLNELGLFDLKPSTNHTLFRKLLTDTAGFLFLSQGMIAIQELIDGVKSNRDDLCELIGYGFSRIRPRHQFLNDEKNWTEAGISKEVFQSQVKEIPYETFHFMLLNDHTLADYHRAKQRVENFTLPEQAGFMKLDRWDAFRLLFASNDEYKALLPKLLEPNLKIDIYQMIQSLRSNSPKT